MKVDGLKLSRSAISFLKSQGFVDLYPPQADSVKAGLLRGKSLLISAPTASGKTMIATLAILSHFSNRNKSKIVYLGPLRALAAEKYLEFKRLEEVSARIKVGVSTGDYDRADRSLKNRNVLVMTNEKMDAIIRRGDSWIDDIGLVIADEIHLIGDETRGPALEMVLTRLKQLESRPQMIGLSATVTNSDKIAKWLGCKLVKSSWRPVPLAEGVCSDGHVVMNDRKKFSVKKSTRGLAVDLSLQSIQDGGQSLIFAETRSRSRSLATKATTIVEKMLTKDDIKQLDKVSSKILARSENTELVKALADTVKSGVAFHHAGLDQYCRTIIEDAFRLGTIKLLTSTPTLAAGVNLPARRVIISSINRYNPKLGMNAPISVLEYKQLCGRAGRPQYDTCGESIIISSMGINPIIKRYIKGKPEPIKSTLATESIINRQSGGERYSPLRVHMLALAVTNPDITYDEIVEFFSETLCGIQLSKNTLKSRIDDALEYLVMGEFFVERDGLYSATKFGTEIAKLYIDPKTANDFKFAIRDLSPKRYTLSYLHLITQALEFFPNYYMRSIDEDSIDKLVNTKSGEWVFRIMEPPYSRSMLVLNDWVNESNHIKISERFGIESGDVYRMVENADRLAYCLREISKYIDRDDMIEIFDDLRKRIRYGIKSDLIDLVQVRGVGRVRARKLYKSGIKSARDLRRAPVTKLAKIDNIGANLAKKLKAAAR